MTNPISHICGVIPAMITCFNREGQFDEKRQRTLTEFLISKHVDGLYLTGSTGETFLMDGRERCAVVDAVIDQARGRVPIIVHVGDIGTQKSIDLAKHACQAGAAALSSVPPFYYHFSQQEIYSYYQKLSEATPLPMIIYNIALAGELSSDSILKLSQLPNVQGMKYTLTSHYAIAQLKEKIEKPFMIYSGCDEMALSGLAFSADGIIGSFYNIIPEIYLALYAAVKQGDLSKAKEYQLMADRVVLSVLEYPYFSAIKRMLSWVGVDGGEVREPFATLSLQQEKLLIGQLAAIRQAYGCCGMEVLDKLPVID